MSDEHRGKACDGNVANMCRHHPSAIGQINGDWPCCDLLVDDVGIFHNKIDVAPVSAMACIEAIVSAFNCSVVRLPNSMRAVAAMLGAVTRWRAGKGLAQITLEQFDVTTVASSSSMMFSEKLGVGFK